MKQFEYVLAVAQTKSFSLAAEQLKIAQSSLSRFISKLESELGIELFDRSTIPLTLTEAGRNYMEAAKKMLDLNNQLTKQLSDIKTNKNQMLRIGIGPSRAPAVMPLILKSFSRIRPEVQISVTESRTSELIKKLNDGELDLFISFREPSTEYFDMERLFDEYVSLAVPAEFSDEVQKKLDSNGAIDVSKLSLPFISLHEGQQLRNALSILTNDSIEPKYYCEYLESAMALVGNGLGVTLAPSYWKIINPGNNKIRFFPLSIPESVPEDRLQKLNSILFRHIGIFYRKEQFLSSLEREFIDCAKTVCAKFDEM